MANEEHLAILLQRKEAWNAWRREHANLRPDLSRADLFGADLLGADLRGAYLREAYLGRADLFGAYLREANLNGANLSGANLSGATLRKADLSGANLREANLSRAVLAWADLRGADLGRADLSRAVLFEADLGEATLVETKLAAADLTGCRIYGLSAWGLDLSGTIQKDLIITREGEPEVTVDNLEVAQFVYLLLHNEKIRDVIDTITSKVVLILGRFTPERKAVLDALREELRQRNYSPVVFDFDKPRKQSTVETAVTLAHMARFVIADLTDAKSVLRELRAIVPLNPSLPVQPLILRAQEEPGMFDFFQRFPWVPPFYRYSELAELLGALTDSVIVPAEDKALKLRGAKAT